MIYLNKTQLRIQLRHKRRSLSDTTKKQYAKQLYHQWLTLDIASSYQHVACYIAFDGEISTQHIIDDIWTKQHHCYLPTITSQKILKFVPYHQHQPLRCHNNDGFAEPQSSSDTAHPNLEVILIPLIAFDKQGYRLGFGQGYYDRLLATYPSDYRPLCIGLAYQFQRCDQLPIDPWDQPLDMIITEQQIYHLAKNPSIDKLKKI